MRSAGPEWFEDETFWERFAPIMFDEDRWAEVPAVADGIARLSGHGPAGSPRTVDLCCGTGRIAVELALRGYRVCGVDLTASYLEAARESAADEGVDVEWIKADVRRFRRVGAFDLALNLYTSFGYFGDPEDDLLFAANARAGLVPGGVFIIETLGKEIAVRDFTPGEEYQRAGYTVQTGYSCVDDWAGLRNRWALLKDGRRVERSFTQRLYAATELRALLRAAGFSGVRCCGDWDGSPYDQAARMLIAVATA